MLWDCGLIVRDDTVINTVAVAVFVTLCALAVIVTVPIAIPFRVALPVPVTVAVFGSLLDQETPLVKLLPCPSLLTPNACRVVVCPNWTDGAVGLIVIELKVGFTKNPLHPT